MSDWQPITAAHIPSLHGEEGAPVLVWNGRVQTVAYCAFYANPPRVVWWVADTFGYCEDGEVPDVSHWMPLPEPQK